MSHLGDRLSALVDGELDGAERDKATAHLARCEQCRTEAAGLRDLKRQLRSLAGQAPANTGVEADMMGRLMAMSGVGATQPRHRLRVLSRTPRGLRPPARAASASAARSARFPGPRMSGRSGRYLALGAVTIVVGLGTAAFGAGGGDASPGPRVTPRLELYSEEHAITTGDVPLAGVPEGSAVPGEAPSAAIVPAQPAGPSAVPSTGYVLQP